HYAVPLQTHAVQAVMHSRVAARHGKRQHVAVGGAAGAEHGVGAHAAVLVHHGARTYHGVIADLHVAPELHAGGEHAAMAHVAVVRHVGVAHDQRAGAYAGGAALARGAVHRSELAQLYAVLQDGVAGLAAEARVHGLAAHH